MGNQAMNPVNSLREQQLLPNQSFIGPLIRQQQQQEPERRSVGEAAKEQSQNPQPRPMREAVMPNPQDSYLGSMIGNTQIAPTMPPTPNMPAQSQLSTLASAVRRRPPRQQPGPGGFVPPSKASGGDVVRRSATPQTNFANSMREAQRKMMMF